MVQFGWRNKRLNSVMKETTSDLINTLTGLVSESQNPATLDIDLLDSLGVVTRINDQDQQVADAIQAILPEIAEAVDVIVDAVKDGGRLVYIGAGTSGRMGVIDAVECVPTFSVSDDLVVALMAGGESAMFRAKEGIEDDPEAGAADLKAIDYSDKDILVGIAASGRTPYVIGAMQYANSIGSRCVALSCNPDAEIAKHAAISLLPIVGPEALSGSTRMKSGTAQKLVLNMLSTATMIRLGKSYHNLMVDLKATNEKLYARGTRMVMEITGAEQARAETVLKQANLKVKTAVYMVLADCTVDEANMRLELADGFLRAALEAK